MHAVGALLLTKAALDAPGLVPENLKVGGDIQFHQ